MNELSEVDVNSTRNFSSYLTVNTQLILFGEIHRGYSETYETRKHTRSAKCSELVRLLAIVL